MPVLDQGISAQRQEEAGDSQTHYPWMGSYCLEVQGRYN
jgi:hypothetical protein